MNEFECFNSYTFIYLIKSRGVTGLDWCDFSKIMKQFTLSILKKINKRSNYWKQTTNTCICISNSTNFHTHEMRRAHLSCEDLYISLENLYTYQQIIILHTKSNHINQTPDTS